MPSASTTGSPTTTLARQATTVPNGDASPPVTGETPEEILEPVLADARERTGSADLIVLRSESIVWNDGSLGCPEVGVTYTQALVDGYWIEISAGDVTFDYRVGNRGSFKLCEGGLAPPAVPEG